MKSAATFKLASKTPAVATALLTAEAKGLADAAHENSPEEYQGLGHSFGTLKVHSPAPAFSPSPLSVQPKLEINQPGDVYEQEADAMAEQVMRMKDTAAPATFLKPAAPSVQRKCAHCDEEEKKLHRKEASNAAPATTSAAVTQTLQSAGRPLEAPTRSFMEARFGHDFSTVRIHTDTKAAESAHDVNALAYTVGRNVIFGSGQYVPQSETGKQLIAHELTHVLQQGGGRNLASLEGVRIQRQPATGVHDAPTGVSARPALEKWSPDVEGAYRRAGLLREANAVRRCREEGVCQKLLTENEAWEMYGSGRTSAGLGPREAATPKQASAGGVAVGGALASRALSGGAAVEGTVAKTAAERAAAAWARQAAAVAAEEAATTTAATAAAEGTAAVAAPAAGATLVTIAAPVAVGAVVVVSIVALVFWSRFQRALESQGYVILPSPLAVCIAGCHQPAAPTFKSQPRLFDDLSPTTPTPWGPGKISEADRKKLEDWLKPEAAKPKPQPTPTPTPVTPPLPRPDPDTEEEERKGCRGRATAQRGSNSCHDLFATMVSGTSREWGIKTPEGLYADFDARTAGGTLYEVKTGYGFLLNTSPATSLLREQTIHRFIDQSQHQLAIAARCGYPLVWMFNDPRVAALVNGMIQPPVISVSFPCNEDR